MLNNIELFRQSFLTRKTEESDTHQYIQRHDPEFHKKKKDDSEGGFKDPYEDLTNVSVQALIAFLEGLLDRQPTTHQTNDDAKNITESRTYDYRPPVDPAHAKAMNAYQTRSGDAPRTPPTTPENADSNKPQTALDKAAQALDQNALKSTIRDLHNLMERGINHITLERGDGFLESIQNAVAKY